MKTTFAKACVSRLAVVALILSHLLTSALLAQEPGTAPQVERVLPTYEGQKVSAIEIAGHPELDMGQFRSALMLRAGDDFDQAKVNESVAAVKRVGHFDQVQLEVRPEMEGVRILIIPQPAMYFGVFEFPGGIKPGMSYARLLQVSGYPSQAPYSAVDVERATDDLVKFFQRNGYFLARVTPRLETDAQHAIVNVFFQTDLGKRAKFGDIKIVGTTPEYAKKLDDSLRGIRARLKNSDIRPGKTFKLRKVQNASQYLENELIKQKHLGAEVNLIGANYNPETNRADVSFSVKPGPETSVKVTGAFLWPWTKRKLLPVLQQSGFDQELLQEGQKNLTSYFQSKGYFDAKVTVAMQQSDGGTTAVYRVTKGKKHKVTDIRVTGNQHMDSDDLLSHSLVKKAHFLGHGKYSQQLITKSATNLENVYKNAGYSSVKVTPQATRNNGDVEVTFAVDEGPQDIVETLRIEGTTLPQAKFAPQGLKVEPGQPYSQRLVSQDRDSIVARYLELGYLTATFKATAQPVDKDKHRLAVVYTIHEGPRVEVANIITLGNAQTRDQLIKRTADLKTEKPMKQDDMLLAESRLYTLGIFDWSIVEPKRQITDQDQEDVLIKVHEQRRNQIIYGFGFEVINRGGSVPSGTVAVPGIPPVGVPQTFKTSQKTFWGPRGMFEYTRRNLRGRAETFTIGGLAARLDQRGSITYSQPRFRGSSWLATYTLTAEHNSENPIFTSRQGLAGFQLQKDLDAKKTKTVYLRYNFRLTGLSRLEIPDLVPTADQHLRLSTLSGTFLRDTRDNLLDAHKGIYESFEVGITPSFLGSSVDFARFLGQTAYYKNIGDGIIWANSIRLGLEQQFNGSRVPVSEQFFSGGGSTLRGFPLNGAGPQRTIPACGTPGDPSTCALIRVPTGGKQLLILNSEFRIPVPIKKGLGVVAFYDGGNVFQRIGFSHFGDLYSNNVGIGLRYATPVGPVRIDIGHNLNSQPGIKATQFFITLGQAF